MLQKPVTIEPIIKLRQMIFQSKKHNGCHRNHTNRAMTNVEPGKENLLPNRQHGLNSLVQPNKIRGSSFMAKIQTYRGNKDKHLR